MPENKTKQKHKLNIKDSSVLKVGDMQKGAKYRVNKKIENVWKYALKVQKMCQTFHQKISKILSRSAGTIYEQKCLVK